MNTASRSGMWTQRSPSVPAGRGDQKVDVHVQRPARFCGQVKRDGEPIEADVLITAGDSPSAEGSPLVIDFPTDASGRFDLPLLAPGTYRIAARPTQQFAGGAGYGGKQTVVLASGSTKRIEVDITIAADANANAERRLACVDHELDLALGLGPGSRRHGNHHG